MPTRAQTGQRVIPKTVIGKNDQELFARDSIRAARREHEGAKDDEWI
jgi:hypothetical protein